MKIIECPRDALQGIHTFIPTSQKIRYLNALLKIGFDTIDFGSFVSPKAIPQMQDTAAVLQQLDLSATTSKLLAIIANLRGAHQAASYEEISYLGFPLSISEQFQQRNTRKSIAIAFKELAQIQEVCQQNNKLLVVYLSMGFGNPYGEAYHPDIVVEFVQKLASLQVQVISLADTIGSARPELIQSLYSQLLPAYPSIEFGAHLHAQPKDALKNIEAVFTAGCQRIDGALGGLGGCPMAKDVLVGNIATETILALLETQNEPFAYNRQAFAEAQQIKDEIVRFSQA
ncbi:hydroxymethylglutaryl-CoA lyase [Rapidithrix thailandica]|uniref:Hydroxymethylglutaryl-CoA lyase n=1 Tax=Rapidithrix thailandica TaxID=413964 RepID=A0AAW9S403_9BACT